MSGDRREPAGGSARSPWLSAGVVGRPHGLDGSFYVTAPSPGLLSVGARVRLRDVERAIERRAGTDARPIIRLQGIADRSAAEALRGAALLAARERAPALQEDEWWAEDLEGCEVWDGRRAIGVVRRVRALPSCEVLEVDRDGTELLVPLVADAVRTVDVGERRIEIDLEYLGEEPPPAGASGGGGAREPS